MLGDPFLGQVTFDIEFSYQFTIAELRRIRLAPPRTYGDLVLAEPMKNARFMASE